jgi:hypothetical protein
MSEKPKFRPQGMPRPRRGPGAPPRTSSSPTQPVNDNPRRDNVFQRIRCFFHRRNRDQPVSYVTTSSGFRYRLLDVTVDDGYDAVAAKLLPGEMLYRMMDGSNRVNDKLFPVLMKEEINFVQSVEAMSTRGWIFQLAAGIPVTKAKWSDA